MFLASNSVLGVSNVSSPPQCGNAEHGGRAASELLPLASLSLYIITNLNYNNQTRPDNKMLIKRTNAQQYTINDSVISFSHDQTGSLAVNAQTLVQ